jgi:hypothetical protein
MSGKTTGLTALETRKQLLLLESELNRTQLLNEARDLKNEFRRLKHQVEAVGSIAASAAKLAATFSSIGSAFSHRDHDDRKPSWISSLLKSARTGVSLWLTLKSYLR